MPGEYQRLVGAVLHGLVDRASMPIDPKDGSLYEDPQPMRLRIHEAEHRMVCDQTIPHRSRVYRKRVDL